AAARKAADSSRALAVALSVALSVVGPSLSCSAINQGQPRGKPSMAISPKKIIGLVNIQRPSISGNHDRHPETSDPGFQGRERVLQCIKLRGFRDNTMECLTLSVVYAVPSHRD
ncbi:MAG: hypothetical protein ACK53L_04630, partial [Pirellulaceae bacterium]